MPEPEIVVYADFHLLDRQVIDSDGSMVGKIDDLELVSDPSDPDGPPVVGDVLLGPAAVGPRLGGRLGRWVLAVQRRLSDRDGPARFPSRYLGSVEDVARLSTPLPAAALEDWVREHLVGRIPGAGNES